MAQLLHSHLIPRSCSAHWLKDCPGEAATWDDARCGISGTVLQLRAFAKAVKAEGVLRCFRFRRLLSRSGALPLTTQVPRTCPKASSKAPRRLAISSASDLLRKRPKSGNQNVLGNLSETEQLRGILCFGLRLPHFQELAQPGGEHFFDCSALAHEKGFVLAFSFQAGTWPACRAVLGAGSGAGPGNGPLPGCREHRNTMVPDHWSNFILNCHHDSRSL